MENNYSFIRTIHPLTYYPMWKVDDISLALGGIAELVAAFIDENHHDDYTLSIYDVNSKETVEIVCDLDEMPEIVESVYHLEHATPLTFIGDNPVSESYVIGMTFTQGMIEFGNYIYEKGKLKKLSLE